MHARLHPVADLHRHGQILLTRCSWHRFDALLVDAARLTQTICGTLVSETLLYRKAHALETCGTLSHACTPCTGEAEPLQTASKVPQAQNRPGIAVKPESLAGCG